MSKAKMENRALPKRFYQQAAVAGEGTYFITLDGKQLKTQGRNMLAIGSRPLAEAVVAEWNGVEESINPDRMPLTRLLNLTIDRAATDRQAMIGTIVEFAGTDLLCYKSPEPKLRVRQDRLFDPILVWVAAQGIALDATEDIMPIAQPPQSLAALRGLVEEANYAELTALAMMVPLLGSAILALAVWKERITAGEAMELARLDESVQAEQWGADAEAEAAWEYKQKDITAVAFFLTHNRLK